MRKVIGFTAIAVVVLTGIFVTIKGKDHMGVAMAADTSKPSVVRHVVFFKFKEGTTAEQIAKVEKAFAELPSKIPQIADFEWGTDISTENLSKGFTHCFFVTFRDEKGRDEYLPSAPHQEFVALVKPLLDDVTVIDYRPQR
ncbi:MAG TPA: Dabb family protein [Pirellulales bacterium]|jgi:hypothetical protein|nr:Dabb family protein [Pirellulales bacterium]